MKQGWKTCKFADVFDLQMGKTPSRENPTYWGDDNMWVSIADMNEQKYMSATKEGITDIAVRESGIKPIPQGTVIMSFKLSIGKVSIATSKLYTNEAIMGFIEKEKGTLVPEYLYYYLKGYKWEGANKAAMGMTLNKKTIAENAISYPPIAEQEKIVAELDCLSEIIEKKKQQLKELDNLAQSIFYEMFVRESKNWEKKKLIDIYKFIDYRGKTPTKISEGIPLITARNIRRGYIDYSVKEYISEEEFAGRQSRGIAQKGDLLFTTEAPMGYVAIADLEVFSTGQRLITFQKKHTIDVNNTYVLHYLLSDEFQMELNNQATGATVKGIKGSKLEQMLIDCPPMQLQKDFASKIEAIEKQKELIAQSIKETETLFNSRMDYYFNR